MRLQLDIYRHFNGGTLRVNLGRSAATQPPLQLRKLRRKSTLRCDSARVPKDPQQYANVEDLRRELEQAKGQAPFTLTRTIQWLSDAANKGGGNLAFKTFRWVLGLDQPAGWRRPMDVDAVALLKIEERVDPALLDHLQALLLIPRSAAIKVIHRCPAAGQMDSGELMRRLVDLKALLPGCNVARMVELVPSAFLGAEDWDGVLERLQVTSEMLRQGLEGADCDAMFESDPTLLFEAPESIATGLKRLHELWIVDAAALGNSDPEELALAVRALGLTGPPKGV